MPILYNKHKNINIQFIVIAISIYGNLTIIEKYVFLRLTALRPYFSISVPLSFLFNFTLYLHILINNYATLSISFINIIYILSQ
jgi:uncharacterized membrane protein (DUF2068 family)